MKIFAIEKLIVYAKRTFLLALALFVIASFFGCRGANGKQAASTPVAAFASPKPFSPADAVTVSIGTVTGAAADVYKGPGEAYAVLGNAPPKTVYIVKEIKDPWIKIDYYGTDGYINKANLSVSQTKTSAVTVKIATFNVRDCDFGKKIDAVANMIKSTGADIACLQEIDYNSARSNRIDMPLLLSQKTGLTHYAFAKAVAFGKGGYGTLIISRFPILESSVTPLYTLPSSETRAVGYAKILTGARPLILFNTHLPYESKIANAVSLVSLANYLKNKTAGEYVLAGDFNTYPNVVLSIISGVSAANKSFGTVPQAAVDNILYTPGIRVKNLVMVDAISDNTSDHNMLVCDITLPGV